LSNAPVEEYFDREFGVRFTVKRSAMVDFILGCCEILMDSQ
jgi:hypothetical protein